MIDRCGRKKERKRGLFVCLLAIYSVSAEGRAEESFGIFRWLPRWIGMDMEGIIDGFTSSRTETDRKQKRLLEKGWENNFLKLVK